MIRCLLMSSPISGHEYIPIVDHIDLRSWSPNIRRQSQLRSWPLSTAIGIRTSSYSILLSYPATENGLRANATNSWAKSSVASCKYGYISFINICEVGWYLFKSASTTRSTSSASVTSRMTCRSRLIQGRKRSSKEGLRSNLPGPKSNDLNNQYTLIKIRKVLMSLYLVWSFVPICLALLLYLYTFLRHSICVWCILSCSVNVRGSRCLIVCRLLVYPRVLRGSLISSYGYGSIGNGRTSGRASCFLFSVPFSRTFVNVLYALSVHDYTLNPNPAYWAFRCTFRPSYDTVFTKGVGALECCGLFECGGGVETDWTLHSSQLWSLWCLLCGVWGCGSGWMWESRTIYRKVRFLSGTELSWRASTPPIDGDKKIQKQTLCSSQHVIHTASQPYPRKSARKVKNGKEESTHLRTVILLSRDGILLRVHTTQESM